MGMLRNLIFYFIISLIIVCPSTQLMAYKLTWTSPTFVSGTNARYFSISCASWGETYITYINQDSYELNCYQDSVTSSAHTTAATLTELEWPFSSMAFDATTPNLIYYDFSQNQIQKTNLLATGWEVPAPIPGSSNTRSVWYSKTGALSHIASVYEHPTNDDCELRYLSNPNGIWTVETVDVIANGVLTGRVDMEIDSTGTPHFVWWDHASYKLFHATRNAANDYVIEALYPDIVGCLWIDLEITADDTPVVGFLDTIGSAGATIRFAYQSERGWDSEDVAGIDDFFTMDMAINPVSPTSSRDVYFVVSLADEYVYFDYDDTQWERTTIVPLTGVNPANELFAEWDPYHEQISMVIAIWPDDRSYLVRGAPDYPTPTPTVAPTATPTTTPTPSTCQELGTTIMMPSNHYTPGSLFSCHVNVCNPGAVTYSATPVFALLDVYGRFYFAPGFSEFEHFTIDVVPGHQIIEILPEFVWPADVGTATDIWFYAAMTDPGISELLGTSDAFSFGWSD